MLNAYNDYLSNKSGDQRMARTKRRGTTGVGAIIKNLREQRGIKQNDLAEKAGIPASSLSRLESGEYAFIDKNLMSIANVLNVPVSQIIAQDEARKIADNALFHGCAVGSVPVVSAENILQYARSGHWPEEIMNNATPANTVAVTQTVKAGSFAFQMLDDSMAPMIAEGAFLVVEPHERVKPKSFVVAYVNDGLHEHITVGQYVIVSGREYFRPANDRYPPIEKNPGDRILGVVRQTVNLLPQP